MSQFQSLLLVLLLWGTLTSAEPLRIGIPVDSPCPKYVEMKCNRASNTCFDGFSIRVFKLILKRLQYTKPYKFIPYNDTYDSLIQQVYLKNFDAAVGDISIVANRTRYVDFSWHYTDMGMRMVVCEEPRAAKAWIFVKPFTKTMWAMTGVLFLYNGLIVWLMEKAGNEELEGSSYGSQFCSLVWLSFTTLFPIHGEELRSNLSRATMVVWLFVALVLTQSYTANLTSMLTVRQLRPSVLDVETLRRSSAMVGCDHGSFAKSYLENVLHFDSSHIQTYKSGEAYSNDLRTGKIKAAFLELAFIKIFLEANRKGFVVTGPTFEIGGYGFVFSKGSPLVEKVSSEIIGLRESGELHKLEQELLGSSSSPSKSPSSESDSQDHDSGRLSTDGFWGLFIISGGTSTLAFLLFQISRFHEKWRLKKRHQEPPVPENDHVIILPSLSKREAPPHMVKGSSVHYPHCWHCTIQQQEFRRSNTL
ncbi:hypothetical protein AAC387_Pa05g0084 [Persea americana]